MAAAAALFAACSSDSLTTEKQSPQTQDAAEQAIVFDSYVNRGTTRAGVPGSINNASIQSGAHVLGFGVFGFYTDNGTYSKYSIPDFMYNQRVYYSSGWTYSPVKYWPNEFGTGAVSDHADHVSFFAYAPYVEVNPANGIPTDADKTKNITRLTSNDATGDPFIKYVVDSDPQSSVDLLWGVAPAATTYSTVSGPAASTVTEGFPYIDLLKASINSKVNFNLKHALAKLNITIDAFVDGTDKTNPLDAKTRIFVRSITISGFAMKGSLNLNNSVKNKPSWYDYDGIKPIATSSDAEAVTFYDGRRDGREAADDGAQGNEKPLGLNLDIIQNSKVFNRSVSPVVYATASASHSDVPFVPSGVTNTTKNLFETTGAATAPIYVIPTEANMDVTIVYDVETIDENLSTVLSDGVTHGSTIENRIYKTNVFPSAIEAGKAYTLNLHLGMTSVKFDADVTEWDATTAASDTDLPHNSPNTVAAGGSLSTTMAATGGDYEFIFTGGSGAWSRKTGDASDGANVDGTGTNGKVTIPANTTTNKKTYTIHVLDATSQEITVTVTQSACALTATLNAAFSTITNAGLPSLTAVLTALTDAATPTPNSVLSSATYSTTADWIHFGTGTDADKITIDANATGAARTATITITVNDAVTTVDITQPA